MSLVLMLAMLAFYNFPTETFDTPQAVVRPVFSGVIPDNTALTESTASGMNLLANATRLITPQLGVLWGASDTPQNGRLLVKGIRVELFINAADPADVRELHQSMTLLHKNATRTVRYNVALGSGEALVDGNTDTTTAAASRLFQHKRNVVLFYTLPSPIWVNTNTDTLLVGTAVAVNVGATTPATVYIDGIGFQTQEDLEYNSSPTPRFLSRVKVGAAAAKDIVRNAAQRAASAAVKPARRA